MTITARIQKMPRELKLFAAASFTMGIAYSMYDSTFNNFINDKFAISGFQRSLLEIPRELPGLLCVFVTALLWFLCSRRLGAFALVLGAVGALLVGFASSTFGHHDGLAVHLQHGAAPLFATYAIHRHGDGP